MVTVLDIETSGEMRMGPDNLLANSSEILSVGWLRFNEDKPLDVIDSGILYFYKPYFVCEENMDAFAVHHLTRAFLQQYEGDFEKNLKVLSTLITGTTIVGKNIIAFDMPYIKRFLQKHCEPLSRLGSIASEKGAKQYAGKTFGAMRQEQVLDVQDLYQEKFREFYYLKNGETCNRKGTLTEYVQLTDGAQEDIDRIYAQVNKGVGQERMHDCLYDVVCTYVIYLYYCLFKQQENASKPAPENALTQGADTMVDASIFG